MSPVSTLCTVDILVQCYISGQLQHELAVHWWGDLGQSQSDRRKAGLEQSLSILNSSSIYMNSFPLETCKEFIETWVCWETWTELVEKLEKSLLRNLYRVCWETCTEFVEKLARSLFRILKWVCWETCREFVEKLEKSLLRILKWVCWETFKEFV